MSDPTATTPAVPAAPKMTATPQQLVFADQDLLPIILSILDLDLGRQPSWFLNIALVSSVFKDAALDEDWMRISMVPSYVQSSALKQIIDLLTANRVEEIILLGDTRVFSQSFALSAHLIAMLAKRFKGGPFLPNLRSVFIQSLDATASALYPIMVPSLLETVDFHGTSLSSLFQVSYAYRSLIPNLPLDAPNLKNLVLDGGAGTISSQLSLAFLSELKCLESLAILSPGTNLSNDAIIKIGQALPCLETLTLNIGTPLAISCEAGLFNPCLFRSVPNAKALFPALETLHLKVTRTGSAVFPPWFGHCSTCPPSLVGCLKTLTVQLLPQLIGNKDNIAFNALPTQFARLADCVSGIPGLEILEITESPPRGVGIAFADVLALVRVQTLQQLTINVLKLHASSNTEEPQTWLHQLIDAAYGKPGRPTLSTLTLPPSSTSPVGLRCLKYVALHARGIENLTVPIDSSLDSFTRTDFKVPGFIPTSTLRHLTIGDTRATKSFTLMEHRNIAHFIDRIFPNLETMKLYRGGHGVGDEHVENWAFIEQTRKDLKLTSQIFRPPQV
ncbi:hypothetical protein FA15DRAFT_708205 [Coprinopsis marcescibilis]|uniref:F-box domain-containing protein n=1 Tax=Coprinopsis marcescibilis TaxID=230819 RepID=A0A5C3KJI4_COPMA|nr:hypothetical protein FA15DRAFT_708205 [Coprinopsis marcescibilis]